MKKLIISVIGTVMFAFSSTVQAQLSVIDPSVLLQSIQQVQLATEQLNQAAIELHRLGNPGTYLPAGASQIIDSLNQKGVGKTWHQLRGLADGGAAMLYDGDGLYHVVGQTVTTADGVQVARLPEDYKKFDAIAQATSTLESVMKDTEGRRQQVRDEIKSTTDDLRIAQTVAEVQKLQGVLNAQAAELGAIDREREAALNHVMAQKVENESDAAKQEQAHKEERIVDFQGAQEKLGQFLIPDTAPVLIPDPRNTQP